MYQNYIIYQNFTLIINYIVKLHCIYITKNSDGGILIAYWITVLLQKTILLLFFESRIHRSKKIKANHQQGEGTKCCQKYALKKEAFIRNMLGHIWVKIHGKQPVH